MITIYATSSDYEKYGSKELENSEIEQYLELASIDINSVALTRIEKIGFENLSTEQRELITKATCLQADYIKEELVCGSDEVESFSIGGDLTINKRKSNTIADKLKISKLAYIYLKRTGLVGRMI